MARSTNEKKHLMPSLGLGYFQENCIAIIHSLPSSDWRILHMARITPCAPRRRLGSDWPEVRPPLPAIKPPFLFASRPGNGSSRNRSFDQHRTSQCDQNSPNVRSWRCLADNRRSALSDDVNGRARPSHDAETAYDPLVSPVQTRGRRYAVAGTTSAAAVTLAAQNLNSGIFPNGSSAGLVNRFAAASA